MATKLDRPNGLNVIAGLVVLAASLLLAGAASAEETDDRLAAFKLFTNCEAINLRVGGLHPLADDINLSRESLVATAEGRLHDAGLYDPEAATYLFINVNLTSEAFDMIMALKKQLLDEYSGERRPATTWATGATGTHGGTSDDILASIDESMGKFLAEFRAVNQHACN